MQKPENSPDTKTVRMGERRKGERLPPKSQLADVWWSVDSCLEARVVDESAAGIGVEVACDAPLEEGFLVYVERDGEVRGATVQHVSENEDGDLIVGLEWNHDMPDVKLGGR